MLVLLVAVISSLLRVRLFWTREGALVFPVIVSLSSIVCDLVCLIPILFDDWSNLISLVMVCHALERIAGSGVILLYSLCSDYDRVMWYLECGHLWILSFECHL